MGDLRTQKTFSSLVQGFLELLEKYRFEDISVKQLCESAQIRRATFYTHFADKYEFLSFFIQEMRKDFLHRIQEIHSELPDQTGTYCDKLFREMMHFFEAHPQLVQNLNDSQILPVMMDIFAETVEKDVYDYLCSRPEKEDDNVMRMKACFYAGGLLQLIRLWMKDPNEFRVAEINWMNFFKKNIDQRSFL